MSNAFVIVIVGVIANVIAILTAGLMVKMIL